MAEITHEQVEALIKERLEAKYVQFIGAAPIGDVFNEVSKADPPDYAWHVLAWVKAPGDEEANEMSFQVGQKDGKLDIYCTWDYNIFEGT
jgi:hypothetical protein